MRLLLIGPPGAGKGTQAERQAERRDVPHVASGDLLREAIRNETPLGMKAKGFMDRGEYVPDELMIEFMAERIRRPDADRFVLDGFPRTDEQAVALDRLLEELDRRLDLVVHLGVPDDLVVERLSGRRICPECQRPYHMVYEAPQDDERCDADGTRLVRRPDDEPETVQRRLDVYHELTTGLLDHYEQKGLLVSVDGVGTQDEVSERIDKAIEAGP